MFIRSLSLSPSSLLSLPLQSQNQKPKLKLIQESTPHLTLIHQQQLLNDRKISWIIYNRQSQLIILNSPTTDITEIFIHQSTLPHMSHRHTSHHPTSLLLTSQHHTLPPHMSQLLTQHQFSWDKLVNESFSQFYSQRILWGLVKLKRKNISKIQKINLSFY